MSMWNRGKTGAQDSSAGNTPPEASPYHRRTGETSVLLHDWQPSLLMASAYDLVLQRLPSDEMIDILIARARPALSWHSTLIHWGILDNELRVFKAVRPTPSVKSVDPAWVAMLLQVRL